MFLRKWRAKKKMSLHRDNKAVLYCIVTWVIAASQSVGSLSQWGRTTAGHMSGNGDLRHHQPLSASLLLIACSSRMGERCCAATVCFAPCSKSRRHGAGSCVLQGRQLSAGDRYWMASHWTRWNYCLLWRPALTEWLATERPDITVCSGDRYWQNG